MSERNKEWCQKCGPISPKSAAVDDSRHERISAKSAHIERCSSGDESFRDSNFPVTESPVYLPLIDRQILVLDRQREDGEAGRVDRAEVAFLALAAGPTAVGGLQI